ncbi:nitrous oxide reductase accessory protein NosL [Bradyrhizobium diazoefficiens]
MILRILCMIVALVLASCNRDGSDAVMPPPAALNSDAMGVFCGMNVLEHPGPKGQIITASRIDPYWFTSVRDTVAFTLMPDQPRDIRAIYVSDMARAPSWEEPGATNWIDAKKAFFVIESRKQGGMGAAEAVPFGNRAAADAFTPPPMAARSSRLRTFRAATCSAATAPPSIKPGMNAPAPGPTDEASDGTSKSHAPAHDHHRSRDRRLGVSFRRRTRVLDRGSTLARIGARRAGVDRYLPSRSGGGGKDHSGLPG